jgi:hypothetical protein
MARYNYERLSTLDNSFPYGAKTQPCCVPRHSGVQALQLQRLENAGQFLRIEPSVGLRAEQFDTAKMEISRAWRTQLRMGERETFSSENKLRPRASQIASRIRLS